MVEHLVSLDPDILCLTEAYATSALRGGHLVEAEPDYGYPLIEGRRKVMLWSREPWDQDDTAGDSGLPPGRFVSGRTMTPLGPVTIVGVCIPWRDAHVSSGRRDRIPWQDHCAYLAGLATVLARLDGPVIVLGDFNQTIPRRTAPHAVYAALEQALGSRYGVATASLLAPLGRPSIDHIAYSGELRAVAVTGISNHDDAGVRLSDHLGVVSTICANAE